MTAPSTVLFLILSVLLLLLLLIFSKQKPHQSVIVNEVKLPIKWQKYSRIKAIDAQHAHAAQKAKQ